MNELWIIYGLVFVAAILGVERLYWLVFELRGDKKAINRRLALSETSHGQGRGSRHSAQRARVHRFRQSRADES